MQALITETERNAILAVLQEVKDPEIPVVSLLELGVLAAIERRADGVLQVELIPTFAGCPAIQLMKLQVEEVLKQHGYTPNEVWINQRKPWSSNMVTDRGRQLLKEFGLSPPPRLTGELTETDLEHAECPHCSSTNTELINPFGPTLCRAMHHCHNCHETFEQFKPL